MRGRGMRMGGGGGPSGDRTRIVPAILVCCALTMVQGPLFIRVLNTVQCSCAQMM